MSGKIHDPAAFTRGTERRHTFNRDSVDPRAGMRGLENKKPHAPAGIRTPLTQHVDFSVSTILFIRVSDLKMADVDTVTHYNHYKKMNIIPSLPARCISAGETKSMRYYQ
jgi:hypothetical protein